MRTWRERSKKNKLQKVSVPELKKKAQESKRKEKKGE
jgi:hypothetical protein